MKASNGYVKKLFLSFALGQECTQGAVKGGPTLEAPLDAEMFLAQKVPKRATQPKSSLDFYTFLPHRAGIFLKKWNVAAKGE